MDIRFGFGYDVHRLVADRDLILGGVKIPHHKGLDGHSDADVLCHAYADSLLGAAALGDIGKHFPDNDIRYKDISSLKLLQQVGGLIRSNNYEILNIDATVVLQEPKISPFVDAMRENVARALGILKNQVSVKATTNEGLGYIGTGEGAAVYAVSSIRSLIN